MSWTHFRDWTRTARTAKRCFLCGETISPGDAYVGRSGIADDGFQSFAMHPECEAVAKSWDESDWECFSEGEMDRPEGEGSRRAGERGRAIDAASVAEAVRLESEPGE